MTPLLTMISASICFEAPALGWKKKKKKKGCGQIAQFVSH